MTETNTRDHISKFGPSGGVGGQPFDDPPPQDHANIRELRIWSGVTIEAVQIMHSCEGEIFECPKRGQSTSGFSIVKLEPGEFITEISGRYSGYIDQLEIRTNKNIVKRFGSAKGLHDFHYQAPDNYQIAGLWGRAGRLIDALGVHLSKVAT